jgi:hypothetical protein
MNHSKPYNITVSAPLLSFLQESPSDTDYHPYSKYKAYVFLLSAAAGAASHSDDHLRPGQFETSYSELAGIWNWHRSNVRQFLGSLEDLGALTLERQGKTTIITLPISFEGQAAPVRLLDGEERQWLRFVFGMASLDEFVSMFESAVRESEAELAKLSADCEAPIPAELGARLRVLLNHLMLRSTHILPSDPHLDDALRDLFIDDCHSDLQQLFTLLSVGGVSVLCEGLDETSPYRVSESAMGRLQEILRFYAPWLEHPLLASVPERG